jgi:phosphoribosylamine---glycine ligase
MNVLVVGSGGREHALAWGLRRSPRVETLWCCPGNAGIETLARCAPLKTEDAKAVLDFLREKNIGLTVIGPEIPLVSGLADAIRAAGGLVFGPNRAAARLEGSKVFAKNFMKTYGIPTADFRAFSHFDEAASFVNSSQWPASFRVVKAGGLAAGKGVVVCEDRKEVLAALERIMKKREFGAAGDQVVLEEALSGEEVSVMALCDGKDIIPLVPSQDHKRVFDEDKGPNTGGMGAYAPVPHLAPSLKGVEADVFRPFLKGLQAEGLDYAGIIYFGLMLTASGVRVLEFNVRFGDPETQAVVPLVENDWLDLFLLTSEGRLAGAELRRKPLSAVCVVLSSGGYPGKFRTGLPIRGTEEAEAMNDVFVFHAGTSRVAAGGPFLTAGGRVLGVTALGPDLESARRQAYAAAAKIDFEGVHRRTDIAARALAQVK